MGDQAGGCQGLYRWVTAQARAGEAEKDLPLPGTLPGRGDGGFPQTVTGSGKGGTLMSESFQKEGKGHVPRVSQQRRGWGGQQSPGDKWSKGPGSWIQEGCFHSPETSPSRPPRLQEFNSEKCPMASAPLLWSSWVSYPPQVGWIPESKAGLWQCPGAKFQIIPHRGTLPRSPRPLS